MKKFVLLATVFLTGACILVVEITALRILSPYFGNTLFSVSSVISTVLGALSLGYYAGGYLADLRASFTWFWGLVMTSGLSLFLIHLLILFILPDLGSELSVSTGPLLSSLLLFFLPSFLLGTLSPFAIRLLTTSKAKEMAGRTAGAVFFWSTLGSIVGSLLAGFVLIPQLGVRQIILSIASLLSVMGFIGLFFGIQKRKMVLVLSFFPILLLSGLSAEAEQWFVGQSKALVDREGVYDRILVYDGNFKNRPTRFFEHGQSHSSAAFLDSEDLVYEYSKSYKLYQFFKPQLKTALVLGGGAYSIPQALPEESPSLQVDVVEIEPELFKLAQDFFRLPDNPRLQNFVEDARRFLQRGEKQYDLILSDAFSSQYSIPEHLISREFFDEAKKRLSPDGLLVANIIGSLSPKTPSFALSEIKTFRSVFPQSFFLAMESPTTSSVQNIILVGVQSETELDRNFSRFLSAPDPFLQKVPERLIDLTDSALKDHHLFTDDYSPGEYFSSFSLQ